MNKVLWIVLGIILVDTVAPLIFGGSSTLTYYLGDSITLIILGIVSIVGILWGLFRMMRGGGRAEGLMAVIAILAANYFARLSDYSSIFDLIGLFVEHPYLYGGGLLFIIFWFGGWWAIKQTWKRSKGVPKGEKEKKAKYGMIEEGITRWWINRLRRRKRNRITARLVNALGLRYPTLPGELHPILKDIRLELYTLMNYLLRHEIYISKSNVIRGLVEKIREKERLMGDVEINEVDINNSMKIRIEGSDVNYQNGNWELTGEKIWGFARKPQLIYELMKKFRGDLQGNLIAESLDPEKDKDKIQDALSKFLDEQIRAFVNPRMRDIEIAYDAYKTAVDRFKIFNYIRAYRLYFLDMYNLYGQYVRGYGFAKRNATPDIYEVGIKWDRGGIQRGIDWGETATRIGSGNPTDYEHGTNFLVEVNLFGYSVSDINAIQIEGTAAVQPNGKYRIRKYKKDDIVWFHTEKLGRFADILNFSSQDWEFYVSDMEKSEFHPYSRSISDYAPIIARGTLKFESGQRFFQKFDSLLGTATFKNLLDPSAQIGFDREALKNPSAFIYWGRKNYYHTTRASPRLYPANPYPGVSILGLWDFIARVALKHSDDATIIRTYLNNYFRMQYEFLPRLTGEEGGKTT